MRNVKLEQGRLLGTHGLNVAALKPSVDAGLDPSKLIRTQGLSVAAGKPSLDTSAGKPA